MAEIKINTGARAGLWRYRCAGFAHVKRTYRVLIVVAAWLATGATAQAGVTFDAVKAKGFVQCGLSDGIPGFSRLDSKNQWQGLDVDLCRAVAAAMFGDASRFKATPLSSQQRFTALQSGEIDVAVL